MEFLINFWYDCFQALIVEFDINNLINTVDDRLEDVISHVFTKIIRQVLPMSTQIIILRQVNVDLAYLLSTEVACRLRGTD